MSQQGQVKIPHTIAIKCWENHQLNPNHSLSWRTNLSYLWNTQLRQHARIYTHKHCPWLQGELANGKLPALVNAENKEQGRDTQGRHCGSLAKDLETMRTCFLHSHQIQTRLKPNTSFHYLLFGLDKAWEDCAEARSCISVTEITVTASKTETIQGKMRGTEWSKEPLFNGQVADSATFPSKSHSPFQKHNHFNRISRASMQFRWMHGHRCPRRAQAVLD